MPIRALVVAVPWLVGLAACNPDTGTYSRFGEPELRIADQDPSSSEAPLIDFGPVFFGHDGKRRITVTNRGVAPLFYDGFRVGTGGPTGLFSVELDGEPEPLGPSESLDLTLVFTPDESDSGAPHGFRDYQSQLTLTFDGTDADHRELEIGVRGRGVDTACGLPKVLDFGNVRIGSSRELSVELRNPTVKDTIGFVAPLYSTSGDYVDFQFDEASPVGNFSLPSQAQVELRVRFSPSTEQEYLAFFHYRLAAECPEQIVTVEGFGFGDTLEWPSSVACDVLQVGAEKTKDVTFKNFGHEPVTISNLQINSDQFALSDLTDFELPPEGVPVIRTVTCKPTSAGLRTGSLRFDTSLETERSGVISLSVTGV